MERNDERSKQRSSNYCCKVISKTNFLQFIFVLVLQEYFAAITGIAASEFPVVFTFEGKNAIQSLKSSAQRCPQGGTTEDSSEADDSEYGFYVIPVQSLLGYTNEINRCHFSC